MASQPTEKQLRYLDVLADQLSEGDAWDLIAAENGTSRSKAQRFAGFAAASAAIESAKRRLECRERRATLLEGAVDGQSVLIGGVWRKLLGEALAAYQSHQGEWDLTRLLARREELKANGASTPWQTAMAEQAAEMAVTADLAAVRAEAIAEVRALMEARGLTVADLA